jgi:alpha-mannosidase
MQNEKIHLERIKKFILRVKSTIHQGKVDVPAKYIYSADAHIPYTETAKADWNYIALGEKWGKAWSSAWFLIEGTIPKELQGKNPGLWFDCDGEACVFKNGIPWQGLTPKVDWYHNAAKYFVPLEEGDNYKVLIEAAANDLFGSGKDDYVLRECALVSFDEAMYQLFMDLEVLQDLAISLPVGSTRRAKIIYGLNKICNVYNTAGGWQQAKDICVELLSKQANASALTAYSVGHAHLDLAWLWPIKESKRKGGRTFANALRLLEQYPEYVFGASQAQLYQWIKELYPDLYKEVKNAVKAGRWEIQGAHWVEFDTNLISGESIIRQFMYGKRFFAEEFGVVPNCLWLPDCFGFSGNLPQFLKGCKVEYFVTQKLSWNETNTFPHHLFIWQGIDGSEVKAHQLPSNDYNFSNNPSSFIKTDERFAQAELAEGFLNLYGIGDGGGGPTRNHIEYGKRQQNLEGSSKFRFRPSTEFFNYYQGLDPDALPKAYGELYLEFHRGTYTTQAKMKQMNVDSQQLLKAAEGLCVLNGEAYPKELRKIWEDTLLLQFHDILPGSSIAVVYKDAEEIFNANYKTLQSFIENKVQKLAGGSDSKEPRYVIYNPCGSAKGDWLTLPVEMAEKTPFINGKLAETAYTDTEGLHVYVEMPSWGVAELSFKDSTEKQETLEMPQDPYCLQNEHLIVQVSDRGTITGIIDAHSREKILAGESNLLQLWEDEPNNWGAWDINHFYKETTPARAHTVSLGESGSYKNKTAYIIQDICIGSSTIRQKIELEPGQRYVRISHETTWNEHHKMLRVQFQPDIHESYATCGIQMGSIKRSTRPQNAWEAARFEFPAQAYIDLSDAKRGCSLICADKFGYSIQENVMEMAILRSPADTDPNADIGKHSYAYAFYCHDKPYADSKVNQVADSIATPLVCVPVSGSIKIEQGSKFGMTNNDLIINCIKPAEDGEGIILRLFEPLGVHASDILNCGKQYGRIFLCNMLEEEQAELKWGDTIQAKPFEIITLRLKA